MSPFEKVVFFMSQESVRVTGILNGAEFFLQPVYFNVDAFLYGGAELGSLERATARKNKGEWASAREGASKKKWGEKACQEETESSDCDKYIANVFKSTARPSNCPNCQIY